ncbi:hypothetical protein GGR50DRAFT_483309 [Xylaria sp. CBS 124048]|nr:hypothetical protein GGR50DRAFT_483309 [Xylaria sp. CBS 124048]
MMRTLLLFTSFVRVSVAVLVADGSLCMQDCGNNPQGTPLDQIVCQDGLYNSTTQGQVFKSCITCESTSAYTTSTNGDMSDLQSMLYNLRLTTAQCLFHLDAGPCSTSQACGRIRTALEYGNFSTTVTPYGYCNQWSDFEIDKCTDCLAVSGQEYTRNFVSILSGACQLRVQPPQTIPLTGSVFSNTFVNVTTPTPSAGPIPHNRVGPVSTGALAGIVIAGVVVILILAGCGVIINGKRRRKEYLRRREKQMSQWPSPQVMGGEMYETPTSQVPLRGGGWSDSPNTATTDSGYSPYPQYFSPYASQYNSPVNGVESLSQMPWPVEKTEPIGFAHATSDDPHQMHWSDRKGKERADMPADSYELQEGVSGAGDHGSPPVSSPEVPELSHPGYSRNDSGPNQ